MAPPADIKVFVKCEPHSEAKIKAQRYRLISCLSLEDQMVDRLLFYDWTREQENYLDVSSKVGWSPFPGGYRQLHQAFPQRALATDCSAFDWTAPAWMFAVVLDMKISQTRGIKDHPEVERAMRRRWREVLGDRCVIRLPNGCRYRQTRSGLMKSGWLLTIAGNSAVQALANMAAWRAAGYPGRPPTLWAMGDDILLDWSCGFSPKPLVLWNEFLGLRIKKYSFTREFAGYEFEQTTEPLYLDKHLYLLAHTQAEQLSEMADAYGLLYARSGNERMWRLIEPLQSRPKWFYRLWAEGICEGEATLPQSLMVSLNE